MAMGNCAGKRFTHKKTLIRFLPLLAVVHLATAQGQEVHTATAGTAAEAPPLRDARPIDAHAHIFLDHPALGDLLERLDLTFINVNVVDPWERGYEAMEPQHRNAVAVSRAHAGRAPWIATFDPADWESPGFAARVKGELDRAFREGALGVKIYKTIGMELRSRSGRYIMPDEPAFSPILDFVASRGKTLYAHIAEPMGAWKPIDDSDPDSSYYREAPHWHMYGHPERPLKAAILAGRDRMLAAHPQLRVVGCHLGSMEEDVDEIARRLERYPNLAVDTAARVTHLALQPRDKVRAFLIRYQDRILYATDDSLLPGEDAAARVKRWEADLQRDWKFFATAGRVEFMGRSVAGLGLPASVLRKLYRENALKWVPGIVPAASVTKADEVVRVGLVQMDARLYDKEYNLAQAEQGIRRAASLGAQIVCTPEASVQGYPRVSLPAGKSANDPDIVAERARILAAAEPIPGPATGRFARLAKELGIWIVFGMDENRGGKLFNSAVLMSPRGVIEGVYSKVHLQNWMSASGVNNGSDFPVWEIEIGRTRTKIGILICYDIQPPESAREVALGGAEILFVPYCTTDFSRPLLVHLFETRALENRVFLARVNYGRPHNSGTSSIIDFEGATQKQLDDAPGVLVGDLNLTALRKVRGDWEEVYGDRYRQPRAYRRIPRSR